MRRKRTPAASVQSTDAAVPAMQLEPIPQAPTTADPAARVDVVALEEARAALAEQVDALEKLRTRATAFVATILALTGFLVGDTIPRLDGLRAPLLASLGLTATLVCVALSAAILWPKSELYFSTQPTKLVEKETWTGHHRPEARLARYIDDMANDNERTIGCMSKMFAAEVVAGGLAVAFWLGSIA